MPELVVRVTNLSPEDLSKLQALPAQVEALVKTAKAGVDAVRSGASGGNPLSALFSTLVDVGGKAQSLPGAGDLMADVQKLVDALPSGTLADLPKITQAIEELLTLFGPLRDAILKGNWESVIGQVVDKAGEAVSSLGQETSEIAALYQPLRDVFGLLGELLSFRSHLPKPEDVARVLAKALVGVDGDFLDKPNQALNAALEPLSAIVPDLPEVETWESASTDLLSFWATLDARFAAGVAIDWRGLATTLESAHATLLSLQVARDKVLAALVVNLGTVKLPGLDLVATQVRAVEPIEPATLAPMLNDVRSQLKGVLAGLTAWTPTEAEARATVDDLVARMLGFLGDSPLGQIRTSLINFQQTLLQKIESLPLRSVARQAEQALMNVAAEIEGIHPERLRKPIHDFFVDLGEKMATVQPTAVKGALADLWAGVETALGQVKTLIDQLSTAMAGAVAHVGDFMAGAEPTLKEISDAVGQIKAQLESFDLSQPTDAVVAELAKLRDKVASLDLSSLPGTAVSALKVGAEALRSIDLTAAVKQPVDDALAKIDPTPLLNQAAGALAGATQAIRDINPANVVTKLDQPVDEIISAIGSFGPGELRKLLEKALEPLKQALRSLDLGVLLAPVTHLYDQLFAKVDAVLSPDLIFAPIEKAMKPIDDLLEALSPIHLLDMLAGHSGELGKKMVGAARSPSVVSDGGAVLKEAFKSVADETDPLFGFRPGDMLMPLVDLHHTVMSCVESLPDEILGPAARQLYDATFGRLQALIPSSIEGRMTASCSGVLELADPAQLATALTVPAAQYRVLADRLADAAAATVAPEDQPYVDRVIELLPDLDPLALLPSSDQSEAVAGALLDVRGALDLTELKASFGQLEQAMENVLPPFLARINQGPGALKDALRSLDPAPLRQDLNDTFDEIGKRLVALQPVLLGALEQIATAIEAYVLPLMPGQIVVLAQQLYEATKQELYACGPLGLRDGVKAIFDAIKEDFKVLDPSFLVKEIEGLRDQLIAQVDKMVDDLLPPADTFDGVATRLAAMKPSRLLAPLIEDLKPLTDLLAKLDPSTLMQPLIDAIARVKDEVPASLDRLEVAIDDVLAAFPDGGGDSASGSVGN